MALQPEGLAPARRSCPGADHHARRRLPFDRTAGIGDAVASRLVARMADEYLIQGEEALAIVGDCLHHGARLHSGSHGRAHPGLYHAELGERGLVIRSVDFRQPWGNRILSKTGIALCQTGC